VESRKIDGNERRFLRRAEGELAAAVRAEVAHRARRRTIGFRCAFGDGEAIDGKLGRGLQRRARRPLAHPAMTIAAVERRLRHPVTNGAAKTAAFEWIEHPALRFSFIVEQKRGRAILRRRTARRTDRDNGRGGRPGWKAACPGHAGPRQSASGLGRGGTPSRKPAASQWARKEAPANRAAPDQGPRDIS